MDKQTLISFLNESKTNCILFDDRLYNPIEIIVVTNTKRDLASRIAKEGNIVIEEDGKRRVLNILTFREIGAKELSKLWRERAVKLKDKVFRFGEEDEEAFLLLYVYAYAKKDSWLRQNIITLLLKKNQMFSESELISFFDSYLSKYKANLTKIRMVEVPTCIRRKMNIFRGLVYCCSRYGTRVKRRLILEILRNKAIRHEKKTPKEYLKYIEEQGSLQGKLTELCECKGATNCLFLKQECDNDVFFVKGNENVIYGGIGNEIKAHLLMNERTKNRDWYLPMVESDCNGRWIRYPFVAWPTLEVYLKNGGILSPEKCKVLGESLIKMVYEMQKCGIMHNDLRPNNIMVKLSEDNEVDDFVLTDFGCACTESSHPWKKSNKWREYFERGLCGTYRYNEYVVDDAASAYSVYIYAGGHAEDDEAKRLMQMIGTRYFITNSKR